MEIKQVGDLIPYHKSLVELWDREEFQPVLAFLRGMRNEAIQNFRAFDLAESNEALRAHVATAKAQLNIFNLLYELPAVIQEAIDQIEAKKSYQQKYAAAQESGMLGKERVREPREAN